MLLLCDNKYHLSLTNSHDALHHGKWQNLITYPRAFVAFVGGDPRLSFAKIFGIRKPDSLGYRVAMFA